MVRTYRCAATIRLYVFCMCILVTVLATKIPTDQCDDDTVAQNFGSEAGDAVEESGAALLQRSSSSRIVLGTPNPLTGVWEAEDLKDRPNGGLNDCMADQLLQLIVNHNSTSVLDLGAGSGAYSMYLRDHLNSHDLRCCDGNAAILDTSSGFCSVCDLTAPQDTIPQAKFTFSLEVAEHIPKDKEQAFLNNLQSKSGELLVLSWAIPQQSGVGHVNCQKNEYVIKVMSSTGFTYCKEETERIRGIMSGSDCADKWNSVNFKSSMMVFARTHAKACPGH